MIDLLIVKDVLCKPSHKYGAHRSRPDSCGRRHSRVDSTLGKNGNDDTTWAEARSFCRRTDGCVGVAMQRKNYKNAYNPGSHHTRGSETQSEIDRTRQNGVLGFSCAEHTRYTKFNALVINYSRTPCS